MAISLAESKNNTTEDYDPAVIDEFRKESAVLDTLIFDDVVNPAGGGATLDYGYRRLVTQPTAAFRALNTEYTPANVTTQKYSVTLAPLGGSFEVDRVIASIGPAASGAVELNMAQKIKAARTKFQDAVINGDTAVDANGFDGLDKALVGSTTEFNAGKVTDWTDFDTNPRAEHKALDAIDEFLSLLDGAPTVILGNKSALARVRAAVRRANQYVKSPVDGLLGPDGRPIVRESYGNVLLVDPGEKDGSNSPIVPIATRTVASVSTTGLTDLYAYRVGLDGFHGVSIVGGQLVKSWLPDFSTAKAVKTGEVELGPVGVALKATKAAAVFRNIKVR
ncbi:major capsid protein [Rhodococcus qingshengii]|uniref:major capsid protein n=1 Tax=Rhodococcus qingshengii TaxID=334542 RepID=UPI0010A62D3B|nr:phage capsid protein [Rhodococcus qingshengii]THJ69981.1 phage capsid protein [Rhodococcus qingshengii]